MIAGRMKQTSILGLLAVLLFAVCAPAQLIDFWYGGTAYRPGYAHGTNVQTVAQQNHWIETVSNTTATYGNGNSYHSVPIGGSATFSTFVSLTYAYLYPPNSYWPFFAINTFSAASPPTPFPINPGTVGNVMYCGANAVVQLAQTRVAYNIGGSSFDTFYNLLNVPNDPTLVGLELISQYMRIDPSSGLATLTQAQVMRIS